MNKEFVNYLNFGGYPEVVLSEKIQGDMGRYVKNDIVDKVLLRDLPSLYGIKDVQELNRFFTYIAYNTGNEFSYETMSKESGIQKDTLKKYLEYLEAAFLIGQTGVIDSMESMLTQFQSYFFSLEDAPSRTKKHISSPATRSACKRINMYLRWMVRQDNQGVDFGIWKAISPAQLICPCDLHVDRVGRKLGLITRKQTDWGTAVELTHVLRTFDPKDPVKYDFALFGLGVEEKF